MGLKMSRRWHSVQVVEVAPARIHPELLDDLQHLLLSPLKALFFDHL